MNEEINDRRNQMMCVWFFIYFMAVINTIYYCKTVKEMSFKLNHKKKIFAARHSNCRRAARYSLGAPRKILPISFTENTLL